MTAANAPKESNHTMTTPNIPDPLDHWEVLRIATPEESQYLRAHSPASLLSHEAQWVTYKDPDTGELVSHFRGPTFHGEKVSVSLERRSGAGCSVGVIAHFNNGLQMTNCGAIAHESGTIELIPREPGPYMITLTLSPFAAD